LSTLAVKLVCISFRALLQPTEPSICRRAGVITMLGVIDVSIEIRPGPLSASGSRCPRNPAGDRFPAEPDRHVASSA